MFIAYNQVRMHDTDMAGILYFARQFRFAHDALEDFIESEGLSFDNIFNESHFVFVIVHAEADYFVSVNVGDKLEVHLFVESIGTSSFTLSYRIYRNQHQLIGTVKTVHVTIDANTRKKIEIPPDFRAHLAKHSISNDPNQ
jgi:1,4-dihydroxy-2-naphthoyl-CoA hydrolase